VGARVAPSRNPNAKGAEPRNELSRGSDPGDTRRRMSRGSDPGGADIVPSGAAAGPILVTLPDEDEGERDTIVRQALRARDDLAKALGMAPPAPVTLRFHPTTDDYEHATDRAWFTSGALVNGELHLLPLTVLRDRGVLDRTIRHELVHQMTDGVFGGRPQWVREGAAIYFAGAKPIPGETRPRP